MLTGIGFSVVESAGPSASPVPEGRKVFNVGRRKLRRAAFDLF